MAFIQKQLIPIPFTGGIDTKTDSLQVQPGNLLTLQNGQFTKTGQINKRCGYDIFNNVVESGSTIANGDAVAVFNNELLSFDGTYVYSYLPATDAWLNRGVAVSCIIESDPVLKTNNDQQLNPDITINNGIEVYAWESALGGVRYSAIDTTSKSTCISNAEVYSGGFQPKCISFGNLIYIFYTDGVNNLFFKTFNPKNPVTLSNPQLVFSDGYTDNVGYDVAVIGNNMYVAFLSSATASGEIDLMYYNSSLVLSATTVVEKNTGLAIWDGYQSALNVVGDSFNNVWVSWATGIDVRTAAYSNNLTPLLADTWVDGYTGSIECATLTGIESSTPGQLQLTYEIVNTDGYNYDQYIQSCTIAPNGIVGAKSQLRSVGLASKAFKTSNGNIFVNTTNESNLQPTYFTVMLSPTFGTVVAKVQPQVGGGLRTNNLLSEIIQKSTDIFAWTNLSLGEVTSEGETVFSLLGVNTTTMDFKHPNRFISATIANNLLFVGGILNSYDGVSVVEQGFHLYPENIVAVAINNGDGYLSTGSYQYQVVYQWTDNFGQVQRSADSVPITVNCNAGSVIQLTIPTLRLTQKQAPRSAVTIVIYRTQANETSFYRVTSTLAPLLNNPTTDSVTFVDILSDSDIAANELIYTSGSTLANQSPPSNSLLITYQNRVFVGGLEDPNELWFSKNKSNNLQTNTIPVEFAAEQTIGVDPRGGPITALGLIGTNLIIFKEKAIFLLNGDGPNDAGGGSVFPDPVMIISDTGCNNPNSVVIVNNGIMFGTDKGIYQLNNDCATLTYIGAPVEDYNSLTITSATLLSNTNQVCFTTTTGPTLVFDYFRQVWGTWTNQASQDSCIFENNFTFIKSNGLVYTQNQSSFTDGALPVYMSFTTPNYNFAGLNGYQRVFRCFLLGTFKGPHSLNVQVAYDYNNAYTQTATIDASSNITYWGADTNWGSNQYWGGLYSIYEFRIDFGQQLCTAIRLNISDVQSIPYNEGYSLSALTLEVGVLPDGNRITSSQVVGTQ